MLSSAPTSVPSSNTGNPYRRGIPSDRRTFCIAGLNNVEHYPMYVCLRSATFTGPYAELGNTLKNDQLFKCSLHELTAMMPHLARENPTPKLLSFYMALFVLSFVGRADLSKLRLMTLEKADGLVAVATELIPRFVELKELVFRVASVPIVPGAPQNDHKWDELYRANLGIDLSLRTLDGPKKDWTIMTKNNIFILPTIPLFGRCLSCFKAHSRGSCSLPRVPKLARTLVLRMYINNVPVPSLPSQIQAVAKSPLFTVYMILTTVVGVKGYPCLHDMLD